MNDPQLTTTNGQLKFKIEDNTLKLSINVRMKIKFLLFASVTVA